MSHSRYTYVPDHSATTPIFVRQGGQCLCRVCALSSSFPARLDLTERLCDWGIPCHGVHLPPMACNGSTMLLVVSLLREEGNLTFSLVVDLTSTIGELNSIVTTEVRQLYSKQKRAKDPLPPVLFLCNTSTCLTQWGGLDHNTTLYEILESAQLTTGHLGCVLLKLGHIKARRHRDWSLLQIIQRVLCVEACVLPVVETKLSADNRASVSDTKPSISFEAPKNCQCCVATTKAERKLVEWYENVLKRSPEHMSELVAGVCDKSNTPIAHRWYHWAKQELRLGKSLLELVHLIDAEPGQELVRHGQWTNPAYAAIEFYHILQLANKLSMENITRVSPASLQSRKVPRPKLIAHKAWSSATTSHVETQPANMKLRKSTTEVEDCLQADGDDDVVMQFERLLQSATNLGNRRAKLPEGIFRTIQTNSIAKLDQLRQDPCSCLCHAPSAQIL